jgi:CRP-like cAMP-binding protein
LSSSTQTPAVPRNRLLAALPEQEWERLRDRLTPVDLPLRRELMIPGEMIEAAYFVETGSVSMVAGLEDGTRIEVGLVGVEGMVGLPLVLGTVEASLEAMVQVPGSALRLSTGGFNAALAEAPSLGPLLLRYVNSFHAQVSQTAACNGRHHIEQRLARWLLMTHDRAGGESFPMTQEFMSTMLGVRRPGVTLAVGMLQKAGLVRHDKGRLHVLDRERLEEAACECYGIVRDRYAWLMGQR